MLKIKEDVDLKELEKFGFDKEYNSYSYGDMKYDLSIFINNTRDIIIVVPCVSEYWEWAIDVTSIDVLYDLIKADLVEKV